MDNVFGYSKTGFLADSEIEDLYKKRIETETDKNIQDKLFKASMYDPRKSDIYFSTKEAAIKAEQIAHKLNEMTSNQFMTNNYTYDWFGELPEVTIYKIVNNSVLTKSNQS